MGWDVESIETEYFDSGIDIPKNIPCLSSAEIIVSGQNCLFSLAESGIHKIYRRVPWRTPRGPKTSPVYTLSLRVDVSSHLEQSVPEQNIQKEDVEVTAIAVDHAHGSRMNAKKRGMLCKHLPSGISVKSADKKKDLEQNRKHALKMLYSRVNEVKEEELKRVVLGHDNNKGRYHFSKIAQF